jgi:coenzyme PQQ synthesis protein D (PqqD)
VNSSAANVASGVVDGRTLILNARTGTYLTLSGSGPRLWQLRQTHGDAGAVSLASAEFGVPENLVAADLARMLGLVESLRARPRPLRWSRPRAPSLRGIAGVPPRNWPSVAATLCMAAAIEVGLRRVPLPRLAALVGMSLVFDAPGEAPQPRVDGAGLTATQLRRVWATDRVYARWPLGDTCLRRALVLGFHLRRGHPRLRIGAGPAPPAGLPPTSAPELTPPLGAHAWVETRRATLLALPGVESLAIASAAQRP